MNDLLKTIYNCIIDGDLEGTQQAVNRAIESGGSAEEILKSGLISAMTEVGRLFETQDFFVPEMLVSARAMKGGLTILKPFLLEEDVKPIGSVVIGTVQGDLHDIGKSLVSMMMEGVGFKVIDLGTDVAPEDFTHAVDKHNADILAMSALLTTTMPNMKATIDHIEKEGLRSRVKIIVGGAPLNQNFAESIGADGYSQDASRAAKLAVSMIE
jgi:5-methyltetrahydrofolate--homocysteine methyltransferase